MTLERGEEKVENSARTNLRRLAIRCANYGEKATARELLAEVCAEDPDDGLAWLWRASLAENAADGIAYLRQVLRIDPTHQTAQAWLTKALAQMAAAQSRPATKSAPRPPATVKPAPPPVAPVAEARTPQCPFCEAPWMSSTVVICNSCNAVVSADNPFAFSINEGLDRRKLEASLGRWRAKADGTNFEAEFYLCLGYMNLLDSSEALAHLRSAAAIERQDPRLGNGDIFAFLTRERVMVVDDSPTVREVVARTLERNGYTAVAFGTGMDALSALDKFKPSLVLLDITMPLMDGYQVCKAIKGNRGTKDVPVVMLSGKDGLFDRVKGRLAGATEYITKPFKPEALLKSVKKHAISRLAE